MSQYYKPDRKRDWNYGGDKFRLSRSKISLFLECPRCFYIDNKLGTGRPPGYPFSLNSAVDALLKKEFDIHRTQKSAHPLMEQYGVEAIPFEHKNINTWRENFKGIEYRHPKTGFLVSGAIDDVWVDPQGELIIVDYKSTSKDEKIEALDKDWHDGYKQQMEVYQWLFRRNGFKVSNTGYFVYANAGKDKKAFDGLLEFEVTLIAHQGDDSWVEPTLMKIKECLESDKLPGASPECDYCIYREMVGKKLQVFAGKTPSASKTSSGVPTQTGTLGL